MRRQMSHQRVGPIAFDSGRFREALSRFPTGVTVVTATGEGRKAGITVSSFNSVSLTPPLVLWSMARGTPSYRLFRNAEFFCVNVLSEEQIGLAQHFARPHRDKFEAVSHRVHTTGTPILDDCSVHLVCRTWDQFDGGDHLIIVGEVVDLEIGDCPPLIFARSHFCRLPVPARAAGG